MPTSRVAARIVCPALTGRAECRGTMSRGGWPRLRTFATASWPRKQPLVRSISPSHPASAGSPSSDRSTPNRGIPRLIRHTSRSSSPAPTRCPFRAFHPSRSSDGNSWSTPEPSTDGIHASNMTTLPPEVGNDRRASSPVRSWRETSDERTYGSSSSCTGRGWVGSCTSSGPWSVPITWNSAMTWPVRESSRLRLDS